MKIAEEKWNKNDIQGAATALERMIETDPTNPAAYAALGRLSHQRGHLNHAARHLGQAFDLGDQQAIFDLCVAQTSIADWQHRRHRLRRIAEVCKGFNPSSPPPRAVSAHQAIVFEVPLALHYLLGQSRSASMDRPRFDPARYPTNPTAGRLTVAYISASIGRHAVSEQFSGAFLHHDRKRFDAQCVALNPAVPAHHISILPTPRAATALNPLFFGLWTTGRQRLSEGHSQLIADAPCPRLELEPRCRSRRRHAGSHPHLPRLRPQRQGRGPPCVTGGWLEARAHPGLPHRPPGHHRNAIHAITLTLTGTTGTPFMP